MRRYLKRAGAYLALIGMALLACTVSACSGCGRKEAEGTSMRLVKTAGRVSVEDDRERSVNVIANLGLFNGYRVATGKNSFAWINLDDVKLTKMDEDSEVGIRREGKKLELLVNSGSLYFHVTEPLQNDETMNIRTATMIIGIRGTEGWFEVLSGDHVRVSLLEGRVECTVTDEAGNILSTAILEAGETADMVYRPSEAFITTEKIDETPAFVREEILGAGQTGGEPEGAGASFSVRFGGVEITELPIDVSVLEADGWVMEETGSDGITYASKDGDHIGLEFADDSKNLVQTVYLQNGNYKNGIFDIGKITLFGSVEFASSTAADIRHALDPKGDQEGYLYDCFMDNDDAYYFELYRLKGLTSCCIVKEGDTDFNIGISCKVAYSEDPNGQTFDGGNGEADRPKIVEHRWYRAPYDEFEIISVEILDDGGWDMEIEGWGAMAVYVGYSFEAEAAGEYAQVSGYDLGGEEPGFEYLGRAKFRMTEDELLMQYEDEEEGTVYYRTE